MVTKSTVPVGTGDEERIIQQARPVSNPEFLREGAAIQDFKHPDRIVIGSDDERAREVMAELYGPLYLNAAPILHTSRRAAELINSFPIEGLCTADVRNRRNSWTEAGRPGAGRRAQTA